MNNPINNPPRYPVDEVKPMILSTLQSGTALPQGDIYHAVPMMVRYASFEAALSELRDEGAIIKIEQPNGVPAYRITPEGNPAQPETSDQSAGLP